MKIIIDRDRWARGYKNHPAMLLNKNGNMCCLGFCAVQLFGFSPEEIRGKSTLYPWMEAKENKKTYETLQKIQVEFMNVNDKPKIRDLDREKKLQNMFSKQLGIEVKFK
jgi:hypothetical protein